MKRKVKFIFPVLAAACVFSANAQDIGVKDFRALKAEMQKNKLRFDRKYSDKNFSANAKFESVHEAPSAYRQPSYFVFFTSKGVEITCMVGDEKAIDLIAELNVGDPVKITATFDGSSSLSDYGFFSVTSAL